LTNTGGASLTISSITVAGANSSDFSQTNTCGASVAAGANCTINVTFTPQATGSRSAAVSIADSAAGSPQSVTLTGTGIAPAVSLSAASLSYSSQLVGTASSAQAVTLTNTGSASLTISSITVAGANSGDFSQTNTCGTSVATGANCTISVTFTPQATGSRSASVSVADNAAGSPQSVSLTGTGTAPAATLSPLSLTFASQQVGTTSSPQTIALTNSGSATLSISSIAISGDFSQTNTCGRSVAAGANCTISVTFTPTAAGVRTGAISVADNAAGSPQSVSLTGTGTQSAGGGGVPACVNGTVASYLGTTCSEGATVYHWSSYSCNSTPSSICVALGPNGSNLQMALDSNGPYTLLAGRTSLWNVRAGQSVDVVIRGSVYGATTNANWPHFNGLPGQTGDATEENITTVGCAASGNCLDGHNGVSDILCSAEGPVANCTEQSTITPYNPDRATFNPAPSTNPYPLTIEIKLNGNSGAATLYSVGTHLIP